MIPAYGNYPPPLPKEELWELIAKSQSGDKMAEQKVILHNLRFVAKIANKVQDRRVLRSLTPSDLLQEGVFGLKRAIDKFDMDSGYAFLTYASFWVKAFIAKAANDKDWMIRLPNKKMKSKDDRERYGLTCDSDYEFSRLVDESSGPEELLEIEQEAARVLSLLNARDRAAISHVFGLNGHRQLTRERIDETVGVNRYEVRQIIKKLKENAAYA